VGGHGDVGVAEVRVRGPGGRERGVAGRAVVAAAVCAAAGCAAAVAGVAVAVALGGRPALALLGRAAEGRVVVVRGRVALARQPVRAAFALVERQVVEPA